MAQIWPQMRAGKHVGLEEGQSGPRILEEQQRRMQLTRGRSLALDPQSARVQAGMSMRGQCKYTFDLVTGASIHKGNANHIFCICSRLGCRSSPRAQAGQQSKIFNNAYRTNSRITVQKREKQIKPCRRSKDPITRLVPPRNTRLFGLFVLKVLDLL